ncbi:MAG: ATP-dependent RecD-like DNA helicase [Clostridiales bacterium]|nr:ATP-dependent RecD-like DNA helicase [Clostridiales bacterium]
MSENVDENKIRIHGSVEYITFRNEETGFTVLDVNSDGELVTVVGVLPMLTEGEEVYFSGRWDYHASFGKQFRAELCERRMPVSCEDWLNYLSSGVIKGIGPSTAAKIVEAFGEDTFDVLENNPRRLATIKGISLAKAEKISAAFRDQFAVREVMIALERYGMTASECLKTYKVFGASSAETIETNPYMLCSEGIGVNFERADAIASSLKNRPDSVFRTMAGVIHVMKHNLSNGHTCLPREKLLLPSSELLGVSEDEVESGIDMLLSKKQIVEVKLSGKKFLFLPNIYRAEKDAADHIKMILRFPPPKKSTLDDEIKAAEAKEHVVYEEKQRTAIKTAAEHGLLILTGGPGTGKTTTLKGIIRLFEDQGIDIVLAAPTGRAAKRMSEVTGREAKTIHRLLEVEWDESDHPRFRRNERNPIEAGAVILDELSMVDIYVFSSLLKALPMGCRLIMVGDSDQLPPVGAGNVLRDMISSSLLPVVRLTEVFRQAMESLIVTNAHKIVNGEMPDLTKKDRDFFFMERNSFAASKTVCDLCADRLPAAYGYDRLNDIQVLCPSRKGETGTNNLNRLLQARINPPSPDKKELNFKGRIFREGDKVMQIKNNYNIVWEKDDDNGVGIFNGDIGTIVDIDHRSSSMSVSFDGQKVTMGFEGAAELELAYAVTVHKSQGNEFEAVIMPAVAVVPQLSYRNLLYTAVTRAKTIMIIVGSAEQIRSMAINDRKSRRYSAMKYFLTDEYEEEQEQKYFFSDN